MKKYTPLIIVLVLIVSGAMLIRGGGTTAPTGDLPLAKTSVTVDLKDGDIYDLSAGYVAKDIDGKKQEMFAYNGSIPGPTLAVTQGTAATIRFTNNLDMPTLLHSHGIRMDNRFDGSQLVQQEMVPGETFDYVLRFPDPGMYWYHPHVREDMQQPKGLFGAFLVKPTAADYWPSADHEYPLFLSDILMEDGEVAPYSMDFITHALMGRFGNTLLANGETFLSLHGEPGEVVRLYVANSSAVRPFNFRVAGAKMKLLGGDAGRYEKETFVDSVVLAPSERAVIDVYLPAAGKYALQNVVPGGTTYPLGEIVAAGESVSAAGAASFTALRTNTVETAEFTALRKYIAQAPDKRISLTVQTDMAKIMGMMGGGMAGHDHGGMGQMHATAPVEWEDTMGDMNTFSTSKDTHWIIRDDETGKENMDVVWKFTRGNYAKIRITNALDSMHPMQHPIHFHGNRFVVLSVNGVPNDNMVWKDTTLLATGDVVDILLELDNVGKWMAHCHIAEHLHSGMMIEYDVE